MENSLRFNAVVNALNRLPHDQTAVGFNLVHDPTKCVRCIAFICTMQMDHLVSSIPTAEDKIAPGGTIQLQRDCQIT